MNLTVTEEPTSEPLTLAEAKAQVRVDSSAENDKIAALIAAARSFVEQYLGRVLVEREFLWTIDAFPASGGDAIILPVTPVQTIDSIIYTDNDGDETTWDEDAYVLVPDSHFPKIVPAYGETWPSDARGIAGAVKIAFTAGYAPTDESPPDAAGNIPPDIISSLKLIVEALFDDSAAADLPQAARVMLGPYKRRGF